MILKINLMRGHATGLQHAEQLSHRVVEFVTEDVLEDGMGEDPIDGVARDRTQAFDAMGKIRRAARVHVFTEGRPVVGGGARALRKTPIRIGIPRRRRRTIDQVGAGCAFGMSEDRGRERIAWTELQDDERRRKRGAGDRVVRVEHVTGVLRLESRSAADGWWRSRSTGTATTPIARERIAGN